MTKSNRTDLETYLGARQSGGGTNLWSGLKRALTHEGVDSIFLLSDGEPSLGEFTEMRDILRETEKLNRLRRITIHCISVGRDSRLLKRLAADTGGRYVRRG